MKTGSILNRHLLFSAVLLFFTAGALLTTPQDALAQATVNTVTISSTPDSANTYKQNANIRVHVEFSENVSVVTTNGTPYLTLKVGTENKKANYKSSGPGRDIFFEYEVASGDTDTDGISIEANQINLNGGAINTQADSTSATLTHDALTANASHKVDGVAPTIATTNGVAITSTAQTYKIGEKIQATVTFTESVTVNTTGGTPRLTLKIGTKEKTADYESGTGSTALVFE